jgi:hypothetical protein
MVDERATALGERLEAIAEELAEMAQAHLAEALSCTEDGDDEGAARAAAEERRVAAARRAVLKAAATLGNR